jgi:hypothetical protein
MKRIFFFFKNSLIGLFFLMHFLIALPMEAKCQSGNCKNGEGIFKFADGSVYEGRFENSLPEGLGFYRAKNEIKYLGQFSKGKFHGKGTLYYNQTGTKYFHGSFAFGKRDGYGHMVYKKHREYFGYWKANKRHGQGTMHYNITTKYEGEWIHNKRNGYGVWESAQKNQKYEGEWKQGRWEGKGKLTSKGSLNSFVYKGQFTRNKFNGLGILIQTTQKYKGQFKENQFEGTGTLVTIQGQRYTGEFKNNLFHGQGTLVSKDGSFFVGQFENGDRNGEGTVYNSNSEEIYSGLWANGKLIRKIIERENITNTL